MRAVLDTNVIVLATPQPDRQRQLVLAMAFARKFDLIASEVLTEYEPLSRRT